MNSEKAHALWHELVLAARPETSEEKALHMLLTSVMIDWINNRMRDDKQFAGVIGDRIVMLRDAIAQGSEE